MKNKAIHIYIKKGLYSIAILDELQDDYQITKKNFKLKRATRFWRVCDENSDGQFIVKIGTNLILIDGDDFESRSFNF